MQKEIVVDTSVILDILVTTRPGHRFAKLIGVYLIDNDIRITVPLHALFEIKSGLLEAKKDASAIGDELKLNEDVSEGTPLKYNFLPIDTAFFDKYFDAELPHIKAGDYMYVTVAKNNGLTLLTEDSTQYAVAKEAGVTVYNIEEFRKICLSALQ